ncbi:MAG: undecaprenyl-diphosphate phosphatase, partial [Proteobacteria bacterium]|nr:undecaprenyl-diphosphate phosphatase [Pseudomonadota bacterium]
MSYLSLVLVAVIQGITEFLPISSSAHLILLPKITGMPDQGPAIDVAVHVGTLLAVMIYFRSDVAAMARGGLYFLRRRDTVDSAPDVKLFKMIFVATIPVVVVGLALQETGAVDALRNVTLIGWTTLCFGVVLWLADRFGPMLKKLASLQMSDAVWIGLAQAISLLPGTSRSGITMTAARALGFEREDAARFSMLLAIPTIIAAGTLTSISVVNAGNVALGLDALIAAALSFGAAYMAIMVFLRWVRRASLTPFVIYRIILGLALIGFGSDLII